jgi:uncharacterized OsmC-like protein
MKKNNVNLAAVGTLAARVKSDPGAAKLQKRVEGTWSFRDGSPQFTATIAHGDRSSLLQADMAVPFGGAGLAPDPLQYMLFGLAACYTATLVMIASMEGVELGDVKAVAENAVDTSRVFGAGDRPLVERVSVRVTVNAPVDDARLARWAQAARESCPFAFTVANAVPLETRIERA